MRFITIRDLRSNSAKIQRELPKEKEMVLTSNGKPITIFDCYFRRENRGVPVHNPAPAGNGDSVLHAETVRRSRYQSYKFSSN